MLDRLRARAFVLIERAPGKLGDGLRKVNEALGRPLADADELDDRRAFAARAPSPSTSTSTSPSTSTSTTKSPEQAPVIVYFMDKQKRDVSKLTDILDANGVRYTATNIQEDPAAQFAIRRDSKGQRLPVVFVAGECLGGREQLVNAASSGALKKKVFGP
ncbi:MAG: glutaredoxin family protein [Acidobacteriota bacterium]